MLALEVHWIRLRHLSPPTSATLHVLCSPNSGWIDELPSASMGGLSKPRAATARNCQIQCPAGKRRALPVLHSQLGPRWATWQRADGRWLRCWEERWGKEETGISKLVTLNMHEFAMACRT